MPSQALYEKPIPVMEPPSPPDPIPVTTTEKITAAAKLAALLAKEILGKEMQSDAVSTRVSVEIFRDLRCSVSGMNPAHNIHMYLLSIYM